MTRIRSTVVALLVAAALAAPLSAGARAADMQSPPVVLKVTVLLSRTNGQKVTASLPFVMMIVSGDDRTSVQMSSQVPMPQTSSADGKTMTSYTYQNVGTSITASAKAIDGGLFNLSLTISDTQLSTDFGGNLSPDLKGLARMQSFNSTPRLILRDGGTISYNAGTDKFTGEIVKVDVTLNVVK